MIKYLVMGKAQVRQIPGNRIKHSAPILVVNNDDKL